METLILPAIHVAILFGLLFWFTKTPFGKFVRDRYQGIADGLNKSKLQVAEAEAKKKEIEKKLAGLGQEKTLIFSEWKEREGLQIKSIQESSERILQQMKVESENNKKALEEFARKDAIRNVGLLTIDLAKKKTLEKLNPEIHRRLNEKFSQEVGGI